MSDTAVALTGDVRRQYEGYPYPPRDPADEKKRLLRTHFDALSVLNHYGFAGRQTFCNGFRALVAGGGTGDSLIHLAWQLRGTDAEVHYVDISEASREVARKRARVRGLGNIVWHHASLLDLPEMGLPAFDYINCIGVLHHLDDPQAGLAALKAVLKDDGVMGIMLYGRYGRTAVYQMQDLLRRIHAGETDDPARLAVAREVMGALPSTNWYSHCAEWFKDPELYGDAGIYDMFLHSCDRAYTVGEVYDFVASAGLRLVTFTGAERVRLHPEYRLPEGPARDRVRRLPRRQREAVGELLWGCRAKQDFYAAPAGDRIARLEDLDNVPFFLPGNPLVPLRKDAATMLGNVFRRGGGRTVTFEHQGSKIPFPTNPEAQAFLDHVDDRATVGEILENVRARLGRDVPDADLLADIRPAWDVLNLFDMLLLRHRSVRAFAMPTT